MPIPGYGNALNVIRTTWDLEQAGCAGIQIEDQVAPKRCGHLSGKQCIASEEFAGKIKAGVHRKNVSGYGNRSQDRCPCCV
jgi:2-methylisocitrate lyase-like PEP mutase family enzyme